MINSALAPPSKAPPLIRRRAPRGVRAVAPAATGATSAGAASAGAAAGKNQGLAEAETRQTHRVKAYRA